MKTVSLKIDESIFGETEKILASMKKPRNRYINEAIDYYNRVQKRMILEKKLKKESDLVKKDSLAVQTNLLNKIPHPSTIICPITTNVKKDSEILRVHLKKGTANMLEDCDIMIDQIRAIDNKRLIKKIGVLPVGLAEMVRENIKIVLELD